MPALSLLQGRAGLSTIATDAVSGFMFSHR